MSLTRLDRDPFGPILAGKNVAQEIGEIGKNEERFCLEERGMKDMVQYLRRAWWGACASAAVVGFAHAGDIAPKTYPPYPDIWDWVVPHPERMDSTSFNMLSLDNGDVLIVYTEAVPVGEASKGKELVPGSADAKIGSITAKVSGKGKTPKIRDVLHQVTLFGGQRVVGVASNVRILRGREPLLRLDDGSKVRVLPKQSRDMRLSSGERLSISINYPTYGQNISYARDCYNGPGRHSLVVRAESDEKATAAVTIFKILDRPQQIRLRGCPYEEDQTFTTRVENPPVSVAYVLSDGTFFAEIDKGVFMRFDARLDTKSHLADNTYFSLKEWNVNLDQSYLQDLTGKKYYFPFPDKYRYEYQPMVDDLYQHLLELKGRATK